MTLRVLIADDELVARKRLARLLAAMPDVKIEGESASGEEVLARVRRGGVDLVLLDIQMPGLTGVEAMQLWPQDGPAIVFCTAHAEHAVQAFDGGAVDYLLKPIEPGRLQKALERARQRLQGQTAAAAAPPSQPATVAPAETGAKLPISTRQGIVLLDSAEISHALLDGELVTVFTSAGDWLTELTLQQLQERCPHLQRVHRRALLNLDHVARLEPTDTGGYVAHTRGGGEVGVSRQAARELRRKLGLRKDAGDDEPES